MTSNAYFRKVHQFVIVPTQVCANFQRPGLLRRVLLRWRKSGCRTSRAVLFVLALSATPIGIKAIALEPTSFAVSSIRPASSHSDSWRIQFTEDGFLARNVTLLMMVEEAYDVFQNDRIIGMPKDLSSQTYDLSAKVDPLEVDEFGRMTLTQHRQMLQRLLSDRFHLVVGRDVRNMPIYDLVVDRAGFKLKDTRVTGIDYTHFKAPGGLVTQRRPGLLSVQSFTIPALVQNLTGWVGRPVVDKTGCDGRYDFTLRWSPEEMAIQQSDSSSAQPSIFAALREQLGLRLMPANGPVEVLVITSAQQPSAN